MGDITETSWCDGKRDRRLGTSLATFMRSSIVGPVSKLRVVDSKKVPETTRIILACQSRNAKTLIGGTNAWPRDRGVQEPGAEMVRDMENFSA
jgi:hypothetical protein